MLSLSQLVTRNRRARLVRCAIVPRSRVVRSPLLVVGGGRSDAAPPPPRRARASSSRRGDDRRALAPTSSGSTASRWPPTAAAGSSTPSASTATCTCSSAASPAAAGSRRSASTPASRYDSSWPAIGAGDGGRLVVTWIHQFGAGVQNRMYSASLDPGATRFQAPVAIDLDVREGLDARPSLSMGPAASPTSPTASCMRARARRCRPARSTPTTASSATRAPSGACSGSRSTASRPAAGDADAAQRAAGRE